MKRILLALVLAAAGGYAGTQLVYINRNPLYKGDRLNGTMQPQTSDNAWKWWVGLATGAFIGAALPFLNRAAR